MATNAKTELVAVDSLIPHPDNPRRGNINKIVESIEANGFYGSILVQKSTNMILAGNHRFQAAQQVGMVKIPVTWIDADDETARRILLADNRTSDLGDYDNESLLELLQSLPDISGTGYNDNDLHSLLASFQISEIEPPTEFPSYDEDIRTDHECPKCGYEWSGGS